MTIEPFTIAVPRDAIDDLNRRLDATRAPPEVKGVGWDRGVPPPVLADWLKRWRGFDWRAAEARLNGYPQFKTRIDGLDLHFVHARSGAEDATPILLVNG